MSTHGKMNHRCTLILLTLLAGHLAVAGQTGTWGDQGYGTYENPILESNYPDNDVIRVGDTFYMMSSTNQFVPGMMILKSRDLVNWEFSNSIMRGPLVYCLESPDNKGQDIFQVRYSAGTVFTEEATKDVGGTIRLKSNAWNEGAKKEVPVSPVMNH
jgi:hypothetical protein